MATSLDVLPVFTLLLMAVLGVAFGSFANVLIGRLPDGHSILGRSECDHCSRVLRAIELIPVVSYVLQRARCRMCKNTLSMQYPIIELLGGAVFVCGLLVEQFHFVSGLVLGLLFLLLLVTAVIDARTQLIPDVLTLSIAVCAILLQVLHGQWEWMGGVLGVLFMGVQWAVSRGKWVGSGDMFLAGALGLMVGTWQQMGVALMLAYIIGALWACVMLLWRTRKEMHLVAFGPFLILGAVLALISGPQIRMVLWGF